MLPSRRTVLRAALASAALGPLAACSTDPTAPSSASGTRTTAPAEARRVLLAYFSRPGENYYYGGRRNLRVGNTEVLAGLIADRIGCDLQRVQAADPYPPGYDATVARNSREQDADARPAVANRTPTLSNYDVVLLASPIWGSRTPMIMSTFTEQLDFTGKTVHPVVTYAVSGLGNTAEDYADTCRGADIGDGLAVRGESVAEAGDQVADWLRAAALVPS